MVVVRRTALALAFSCFAGLSGLALAACSFDWTIRHDPGDAALVDATQQDTGTQTPDATTEVDASFDVTVPGIDAGTICDDLLAKVEAAQTNARACTLGVGQCMATVTDQCGCGVYVAIVGSSFANKYKAAVDAYKASCTPTCTGCGSPPAGSCLQHGDGGIFCFPP
jgi:hypothetical protein